MTTPDRRIGEILGGLGSGGRTPRKKKPKTLARLAAIGAVGAGGVLAYDFVERESRAPGRRPPAAHAPVATADQSRACLNALAPPQGDSPYQRAVSRYAYRGGADYVNCVAESVCARLRDDPVTYFYHRLSQPNTCRRLTGACGRVADAVEPADAVACAFDPAERVALDRCFQGLDERDREALRCALDANCGEQTYAARYGVSPAMLRQQVSRARQRLGRCLGETSP
ncbi:hypothetical protein L6V77_26925 [Myxococcota bacterium]|nr:hypothetical protein [Myxococcota bacterium]